MPLSFHAGIKIVFRKPIITDILEIEAKTEGLISQVVEI